MGMTIKHALAENEPRYWGRNATLARLVTFGLPPSFYIRYWQRTTLVYTPFTLRSPSVRLRSVYGTSVESNEPSVESNEPSVESNEPSV